MCVYECTYTDPCIQQKEQEHHTYLYLSLLVLGAYNSCISFPAVNTSFTIPDIKATACIFGFDSTNVRACDNSSHMAVSIVFTGSRCIHMMACFGRYSNLMCLYVCGIPGSFESPMILSCWWCFVPWCCWMALVEVGVQCAL